MVPQANSGRLHICTRSSFPKSPFGASWLKQGIHEKGTLKVLARTSELYAPDAAYEG